MNYIYELLEKILKLSMSLAEEKKQVPVAPIDSALMEDLPKEEPAIVVSPYDWSSPKKVRHSIRVICDEYGMTWGEKNLLCAVIQAESGFNTKAVLKNVHPDGSVSYDYGLCQYNSYWYIERGKLITKDQAMNDPEFCVRLMIKVCGVKPFNKTGRLSDWWAYKNGSYKRFLF